MMELWASAWILRVEAAVLAGISGVVVDDLGSLGVDRQAVRVVLVESYVVGVEGRRHGSLAAGRRIGAVLLDELCGVARVGPGRIPLHLYRGRSATRRKRSKRRKLDHSSTRAVAG